MSKCMKRKKNKVPKITEEQYVAYVSALKSSAEKPTLSEKSEKRENNGMQ